MIRGTAKKADIRKLLKCPTSRSALFRFYMDYGATRNNFEFVLRYIETTKKAVYFDREYLAFYEENGNLLSTEDMDWGD